MINSSSRPGEKPETRKKSLEETTEDVISVMRTSLTRNEFASAMGMRPNNVFVRKMFRIVDKDGDGMISFQGVYFHLSIANLNTTYIYDNIHLYNKVFYTVTAIKV